MTDQELYQQYLKETGAQPSSNAPSEEELYQQYLAETGSDKPQEETVVNEMPEGLKGRFIYKNLGSSSPTAFNYLEKQNPDFEFKKDKEGEVLARKRGAQAWGRLDPKGIDPQDITDIAYDVPAGILQGLATAAAGVAGAGASLPLGMTGAIPAAMAASAGTGAGLEAIRQGLGTMAGIEDNMSGSDIALSGGIGAVSPLMFGTGAGGKEILKQSLKEGSKQTVKDIANTQRGLLGRGYDAAAGYVGPKLGAIAGGYDTGVLKKAASNLKFIKETEKNPELGSQMIEQNKDLFINSLEAVRKETGQALEQTAKKVDALGGVIETKKALEPLMSLRKKLTETGVQNEARQEAVGELDDIVAKYFTVGAGEEKMTPMTLTTSQVQQLRNDLTDYSKSVGLSFKNIGTTKSTNQAKSAGNRDVLNALASTTSKMKSEMDDVVSKLDPKLKGEMDNLNSQYSAIKEMQDDFYNSTKTEESFQRFLKKGGVSAESAKKRMSEIAGKDMNDVAKEIQAMEMFRNPKWQIPAMGNSNTARTLGLGGLGAYLGSVYGQESGSGTFVPTMIGAGLGGLAGSPAALRGIMSTNQFLREAPQNLPGYKVLPYSLINTYKNDQGE